MPPAPASSAASREIGYQAVGLFVSNHTHRARAISGCSSPAAEMISITDAVDIASQQAPAGHRLPQRDDCRRSEAMLPRCRRHTLRPSRHRCRARQGPPSSPEDAPVRPVEIISLGMLS